MAKVNLPNRPGTPHDTHPAQILRLELYILTYLNRTE